MADFEFKPYGKTSRYTDLGCTITEKIDGTNACVVIHDGVFVGCQSRNKAIGIHDDNAGFANWAYANAEELQKLGDGYHYGEWAGPGIQKNPHKLEKKTFFLFNVGRPYDVVPECVSFVPVLYEEEFQGDATVDGVMWSLRNGALQEGYTPEGIIIYFHSFRAVAKYTFEGNASKWSLTNE